MKQMRKHLKATIESLTTEANEKINSANEIIKNREERIQKLNQDKVILTNNIKVLEGSLHLQEDKFNSYKKKWLISKP